MPPQMARIRNWINDNYPEGKDKLQILRWASPRADRAEKKKAGIKTKSKFRIHKAKGALGSADKWFALFIRLRDCLQSGEELFGICCTCGKLKSFIGLQCGHWIQRGNYGTRFDEDNCHIQCVYCNSKMGLNGAVKEHEAYISRVRGASTVRDLQIKAALYTVKPRAWTLDLMSAAFEIKAKALPNYELWNSVYNNKKRNKEKAC